MMNLDKLLKNERLTKALIGLSPQEFDDLLTTFTDRLLAARKRAYYANPERERKPGGGKKGILKTLPDKLFFILFYYRQYPTYDVLAFLYNCDRSAPCRRQQSLTKILESALGRKLVLPKRQLRSVDDFFKAFPEAREIFPDATERPIQRPKNREKQKANYSGKKHRHTRKNVIISDRNRYIGFLGKTVEGKIHDFKVFKEQAPPRYIPTDIRQRVDLGFKGYKNQYPNHTVSIPERKPRTRDLSPTVKEQNKRKSRIRVLAEHALAGVKRFKIVSDVFRNKLKDSDDKAMLISCGLWNYHLSTS